MSAAHDVIDSAVSMVETSKNLAANPQDPSAHHSYSALSHQLSESIKSLLTAMRCDPISLLVLYRSGSAFVYTFSYLLLQLLYGLTFAVIIIISLLFQAEAHR